MTTLAPPRGALLPKGAGARRFAAGALTNSMGVGFFYSFALLYYHAVSGLALSVVGSVLTVAGLAVLPLVPAVGRLADRIGAKSLLILAAVVRAAVFAGYETTRGLAAFAAFTVLAALGTRAEQVAAPMLCAAAPAAETSRWISLYRAAFNAGAGVGALLASLLLAVTSYHALGRITALCFLGAALIYATLPATPDARPTKTARPTPVWRDVAFLRVAVVNGVLWLVMIAVEYGLPVYFVDSLRLATWTVGAFFAVNTALLALLQLPVGRALERFDAGRALVAGALLYVAASVALAAVHALGASGRLPVVLAVVLVWTAGEMVAGVCVVVLLTRLAPPERRGGYLAFNQILVGISTALAPLLVTGALAAYPPLLWWAIAALVVAAAAHTPTRAAGRARDT
jgi:MFS family permease